MIGNHKKIERYSPIYPMDPVAYFKRKAKWMKSTMMKIPFEEFRASDGPGQHYWINGEVYYHPFIQTAYTSSIKIGIPFHRTDVIYGIFFPRLEVGDVIWCSINSSFFFKHTVHSPHKFQPVLPNFEPLVCYYAHYQNIHFSVLRDGDWLQLTECQFLSNFFNLSTMCLLREHKGKLTPYSACANEGIALIPTGDGKELPHLYDYTEEATTIASAWLARRQTRASFDIQGWATRLSYLLGGLVWQEVDQSL